MLSNKKFGELTANLIFAEKKVTQPAVHSSFSIVRIGWVTDNDLFGVFLVVVLMDSMVKMKRSKTTERVAKWARKATCLALLCFSPTACWERLQTTDVNSSFTSAFPL